jgi:hypothetical protein
VGRETKEGFVVRVGLKCADNEPHASLAICTGVDSTRRGAEEVEDDDRGSSLLSFDS